MILDEHDDREVRDGGYTHGMAGPYLSLFKRSFVKKEDAARAAASRRASSTRVEKPPF